MKRPFAQFGVCLIALWGLASPLHAISPHAFTAPTIARPSAQAESENPQYLETDPSHPRHRVQQVVQFGSSYHLKANEETREVVVIFAPATIDGRVQGDVVVVGGHTTVNGVIEGNLICPLGSAVLGPKARVNGDVVVVGGILEADPSSEIGGEKREFAFAKFFPHFQWLINWFREGLFYFRPLPPGHLLFWGIAAVFTLVYLALALILPKPVAACAEALETKPIISFFSGLLMLVACGPIMVVMSITVIGPLVVMAAYLAAAVLGRIAVLRFLGIQLGRGLAMPTAQSTPGSILTGAALVTVLYAVPVLGMVIWLLFVPLGLGAATVAAVIALQARSATRQAARAAAATPDPQAQTAVLTSSSIGALASSPSEFSSPPVSSPAAPEITPNVLPHAEVPPTLLHAQQPPPIRTFVAPVCPNLDYLSAPRVGFWMRLLATILDFIPLAIVIPWTGPAWILVWTAYHVGLWTWRGTTIGGIVLGLKVIRQDGRDLDLPVALVRSLGSCFSLAVIGLGFFWAGWSKDKQAWHDKIAGTLIVRVPKGLSLI